MLLFCIAGLDPYAQTVTIKADQRQILIGERLQYEVFINLPADGYAINLKIPDSIPHFEVIENSNFDTISNDGNFSIHKKIIFTSFDSGTWHIPAMEILLEKNTVSSKLVTDSMLIDVGYSPSDSTNQLRDIKPVMEVTVTDYTWMYIAGGILAAILIGLLLYWYFKKRKKKPEPVFHSALSPYEEAMKALDELKQYDLAKPEEVKNYYVSLNDIFKKYYSRKRSKDMMSKTTGDILISIKEGQSDPVLLSTIAEALRCADAVKFAKYIPGIPESNQRKEQVKEAIGLIEKDQPIKKEV